MRRKIIVGCILFVVGILLQEVSGIIDIWIIGVFGGILWPIGMIIGINSLIFQKRKRQSSNPSNQSTEKD